MNGQAARSDTVEAASELLTICREIVASERSLSAWSALESDDEFQSSNISGGFDATEGLFWFSLYQSNGEERWFSLSLEQAGSIAAGIPVVLELRPAE